MVSAAVFSWALFPADVDLTKGVFNDTGGAEENLLEGSVFATGDGLDLLWSDGVGDGPKGGSNLFASNIKLRGDDDFVESDCGRLRSGTWLCLRENGRGGCWRGGGAG